MSEKIDSLLCGWARELGEQGDVVISSRVRLARNLRGLPFPQHANREQLDRVLAQTAKAAEPPDRKLRLLRLDELEPVDRLVLVEKNLISPQHADRPQDRGVLLNEDESVSVMVNEEDHLRIQTILPGLRLTEAWRLADEIDDSFEAKLPYAFDEHRGYLTACPTNVGTGLRVSVMLHLPALSLVDQARKILSALAHLGFNVRGLYGEGSESQGGIFQLSNQITLGQSEEEIVNTLMNASRQIIEHERAARQALKKDSQNQLEDRLWRSYGLLANARTLGPDEAIRLLSDLKLGLDLELIPNHSSLVAKELILLTRAGILQKLVGRDLDAAERDYHRAAMVRDSLKAGREQHP